MTWMVVNKADRRAARLYDGHYSRRKRSIGKRQFMPPGQTLVLYREGAMFGWWRPHPRSGIRAMNGLDGWTCSVFRNTSSELSSMLILAAERALVDTGTICGPDGLLTYVYDAKVRSANPGYCFKCAGWIVHPTKPRSADDKKTLLWKPWPSAGLALEAA